MKSSFLSHSGYALIKKIIVQRCLRAGPIDLDLDVSCEKCLKPTFHSVADKAKITERLMTQLDF